MLSQQRINNTLIFYNVLIPFYHKNKVQQFSKLFEDIGFDK